MLEDNFEKVDFHSIATIEDQIKGNVVKFKGHAGTDYAFIAFRVDEMEHHYSAINVEPATQARLYRVYKDEDGVEHTDYILCPKTVELTIPNWLWFEKAAHDVMVGPDFPEGEEQDLKSWKYPPKLSKDNAFFKINFPGDYEAALKAQDKYCRSLDYLEHIIRTASTGDISIGKLALNIKSRLKMVSSICEKALRWGIKPRDVHDINGIRIIVANREDCYRVLLGLKPELFGKYVMFDRIASPRVRGFQALSLRLPKSIEIQIQTKNMFDNGEKDDYRANNNSKDIYIK